MTSDLPAIRIALARAEATTSLRHVAREVGLTPSGLRKIIEGEAAPYTRTMGKLQRWYAHQAAGTSEAGSSAAKESAWAVLLADFLPEERERIRAVMADVIPPGEEGTPAEGPRGPASGERADLTPTAALEGMPPAAQRAINLFGAGVSAQRRDEFARALAWTIVNLRMDYGVEPFPSVGTMNPPEIPEG